MGDKSRSQAQAKYAKSQTWLNKLGKKWADFWNEPITIQYAHSPYDYKVVANNGPHEITLRRGDAVKQAAAAVTVPLLEVGLATAAVPTLVGLGVGAGADALGNYGGRKITATLGGDENAQEMVGDIVGATAGLITGGKAGKGASRVQNYFKNILPAEEVMGSVTDALKPGRITSDLSTIHITPEELAAKIKLLNQKETIVKGHGTGRKQPDPWIFFDKGLRVKGGDLSNTSITLNGESGPTLKQWPHLNSDDIVLIGADSQNAIYEPTIGWQFPDAFPKGSFETVTIPGNKMYPEQIVTRPTSNVLYTSPKATIGVYNNKTGTFTFDSRNSKYAKLFGGTSKISTAEKLGIPKSERNNATRHLAKYADEYDRLISRGIDEEDIPDLQRLVDKYYKHSVEFPIMSSQKGVPMVFMHASKNKFNIFNKSYFGQTDGGFHGEAFYLSPTDFRIQGGRGVHGERAIYNAYNPKYRPNLYQLYLRNPKPYTITSNHGEGFSWFNRYPEGAVITNSGNGYFHGKHFTETLFTDPSQVKLVDAITYDDAGNIIPLRNRFNWKNPDIRYDFGGKLNYLKFFK